MCNSYYKVLIDILYFNYSKVYKYFLCLLIVTVQHIIKYL